VREDGRGPSIWDTFSHQPSRVRNGDTGDVACDQYHRFADDVATMADLGIGAYRFSIAWPRIQPDGRGPANQRGLDHYRQLVDALNTAGIRPVATLYHWDLPQGLEDAGGWPNRDTASRFAEYAEIVHGALSSEVSHWITLNEPWVAAWLGYSAGVHAPGRTDDAAALAATHHQLLGHGLAMDAMRGDAGIALNLEPHEPATADPEDAGAARLAGMQMNQLFLDPLFGRGYPQEVVEHYGRFVDLGFIRPGDLDVIAAPLPFLGVNYYRRQTIAAHPPDGRPSAEVVGSLGAWSIVPPDADVTAMGWPVDPSGLFDVLSWVDAEYGSPRMLVTENGAAFDDAPDARGEVRDEPRISYLKGHVAAARDAVAAGVPLEGYFVWSLLDNFEWAEGYGKRFGIVHVDYATQRRQPKASARWYAEVIERNGP
jgi:beta-glucosidase